MKRYIILIVLGLGFSTLFAQTETATRLYKEATADRSKTEQFLKQDFANIDSTSMHDLAVMFYLNNDYRSAGICWEIALQKVKKHGKAYEQILNALCGVYMDSDDNEKISWLLEVIKEHNEHQLKQPCNDYKCKLERAQYYITHGNETEAREHIRQSLELCQTEEQRIEVEEAYAKILFDVRDYLSSAQYYLSASNRWKKLGSNPLQMGIDMYWAAQIYQVASDFDAAEKYSREALKSFEGQKDDNEKTFYFNCLVCLGDAYYCQQKNQEALKTYQIELEGYASWMPNSEKHADALEDVAKAEVRLGKYEDAKAHYNAALSMYEALGLDKKYSNTYSSLIVCHRKSGDNDKADQMEQEAENMQQDVYKRILNDELQYLETTRKYLGTITYTNSLSTIAGCNYGLNRYAEAAKYYALYAESLREMLRERFSLMTDVDRTRVWKEQQQTIDDFYYNIADLPDSAMQRMQGFVPTLYDLELISKGIVLNSSIEFEKVLKSMDNKKLSEVFEQVKANQKEIQRLQMEASDENLQKVLELKQKNLPLEQQLMKGCKAFKDYTEYLSYTWQDVQRQLDNGDVAIEFTMVQLTPLDEDSYLLALILSKTGEPVMEVVSTRAIINTIATRQDLFDNPAYYNLFWGGSLRKHIEGKSRIFFAPNNMLSNIAVEYLKEGERPFFENREVYRLSSTKELCKPRFSSSSAMVCIFGDVDYQTDKVAKDRVGLGRLEFSRAEIDAIAKSMKKKYKVKIYDKEKATEAAFRNLSDNCPYILHVSSHGEYNGDNKTSEEEAMSLSTLALAGCNLTGKPQEADGFVTAADVADMNLRDCDMTVLSACYTGVGGHGADGVFGLQRGFKNAGVHTLMMSLKAVPDESTSKLMAAFYEGIAKGMSKRKALIKAQENLRSSSSNIKGEDWASFILLDAYDKSNPE